MTTNGNRPDETRVGTGPAGQAPNVTVAPAAPEAAQATPEASVAAEWTVGDVILDRYEVKAELGVGAMGKVFRVHDRDWDMVLAVKNPKADSFQTETQKENFLRECHTWMDLGLHNHIVTCYYVRVLGGIPRVFADYVDGGSLKDWIDEGRLYEGGTDKALERVLDIAIQFAMALHYAHEKGFVHQDIKPANVMMTQEGMVKLTDFGLANARAVIGEIVAMPQGASILASYGGMTPAYCSPEQAGLAARRQAGTPAKQIPKLTRRTDLYSWAVSVLELFTGAVTWQAGNVAGHALESYLQHGPDDDYLPVMPAQLAGLLRQCLQQDPDARPHDMNAVAGVLREIYEAITGRSYPREMPVQAAELADVLNNKALSFLELDADKYGDHAETLWREALALDSHHLESTYNLGVREWRTARIAPDELVRRMEEVKTTYGSDWRDKYLLGLVHFESGDGEKAVRALEEAAQASGNAPEVMGALEEARRLPAAGCVRVFEGHKDSVNSICLSGDGRWALSGSSDCTLRLWDIETGQCMRVFKGHMWDVNSVFLSSDGRWALSGSVEPVGTLTETLHLWDVATGQCVRVFDFDGYTNSVNSVCLSADGRWALSGSVDKTLRLWDVSMGQCMRVLEGHMSSVNSVCLSEDGRWALSGSEDKTLRLWDVSTGQCMRVFKGHAKAVRSVCLSGDGCRAVSGSSDNTLRLWDVSTGRCMQAFKDARARSVCLSEDGRWALSGSSDHKLRLWEVGLAGHSRRTTPSYALARVVAAEAAAESEQRFRKTLTTAQYALSQGRIHEALECVAETRALPGRERDRETLDLWCRIKRQARVLGFRGGWHLRTFEGHTDEVSSVCLSADGRWALSGGNDKTLRLWDVATGRCVRVFEEHTDSVGSLCLSADGRWALSSGWKVRLWDMQTGCCVRIFLDPTAFVSSICLSADEYFVLSGSSNFTLHLWEISTGRWVRVFEGHTWDLNSVCLSADGRWALSGGHDNTLRLWEVTTGRCVRVFEGHESYVTSLCLSADGRWALSGSGDKTLRLWDVATGCCVRTFKGHTSNVTSVCLSTDGRWMLSASEDRTIRLWELDWELEAVAPADWDEGARPYLDTFLTLHTPYAAPLPDGNPSDAAITRALTRKGTPKWTEDDFKQLLDTLANVGYGWLRPEGVLRELKKMVANMTDSHLHIPSEQGQQKAKGGTKQNVPAVTPQWELEWDRAEEKARARETVRHNSQEEKWNNSFAGRLIRFFMGKKPN